MSQMYRGRTLFHYTIGKAPGRTQIALLRTAHTGTAGGVEPIAYFKTPDDAQAFMHFVDNLLDLKPSTDWHGWGLLT